MRNEACAVNRFPDRCVLFRQYSYAPSLMLVLLLSLLLYLVLLPLVNSLYRKPIRPEMAPSCEPCADNRPDDMRMKLFSREKGDAKLQRNR